MENTEFTSQVSQNQTVPSDTISRFRQVQTEHSKRVSNFNDLYNLFNGDAIKSSLNASDISYVHNMLALTINDYAMLETSSFEIQLPPHDNTEEGKSDADIIEKFLYSVWERNHQLLRIYDIMFFKNLYGEAPIHVFPHKDYGIRILVADPRECFPVMEEGTDNIWEMFVLQKRTNNQLRKWNPNKFPNDYTKRDVLFYWNQEMYEVMTIEGELVWSGKHGLGSTNWVLARNPYYPGEIGGFSSIEWTAGLCKYLNQLMSDLATIVHYNSAPIIIGEGTKLSQNEWMSGPNVFNPIAKGGKVYPLIIGEPVMLSNQIQRVMEHHDEASGLPGIVHGNTEDSAVSEKAIKAKSAGAELRVELRRNLIAPALNKVNEFILRQTEKLYSQPIGFCSAKSSKSILILDPKKIDGNYITSIQFPIGLLDYASKVVTILQMVNAKLMSKLHAMDLLQIRSPRDETEQIQLEAMEELKHELALKQAASIPTQIAVPEVTAPSATGGRPPGPAERMQPGQAEAADFERMDRHSPVVDKRPVGRPGEPTPRPHEVAREIEGSVFTPQEQGRLVLDEVVRALATIDRIRGRIFVFGELAEQGWTEGQIDLMLTDMIDKQTILNALPMWKGRFNFIRTPKEGKPNGQFVPVPHPEELGE